MPKRNSRCLARQHGDQMICADCGLVWDVNDPEPPTCAPVVAVDRGVFVTAAFAILMFLVVLALHRVHVTSPAAAPQRPLAASQIAV